MTDDSDTRAKVRAVFLTFVMATSIMFGTVAFSGSAVATATVANTGTPDDIAGRNSDTSQQLASSQIDIDAIDDGTNVAVQIDISDLEQAGVDISNADVDITNADLSVDDPTNGGDSAEVAFSNVDSSASEVQLVLRAVDGDADDEDIGINIDSLTLTGLDTSGVNTASGLEYVIRAEEGNNGDFSGSFSTEDIGTTGSFSIATIEVENLATGEQITTTTMVDAIDEANNPASGDLSGGSAGDQVEIRPRAGTFTFDSDDITSVGGTSGIADDNTRIVPLNGGDVTFQHSGDGAPLLRVDATGVEIQNITIDQNNNDQVGIDVLASAGLTVSDSAFENSGGGGDTSAFLRTNDDAGSVTVDSTTFEDGNNNDRGILVTDNADGADLTVTNSEFVDLATGIDLSASVTLNSASITGNTFNGSDRHVDDTGNNQVNLNDVFANNEFNPFVIVEDSNADIQNQIYGDLATADGDVGVDNADHTTTFTGEHSDDRIDITSNGVTLQAADGADTATITATGANPILRVGQGETGGDVNGLTVDDVTFDLDGNDAGAIVEQDGTGNIDDLTVTNSEFLNIGGTTSAAIELDPASSIDGLTVNNNNFDSSNNYEALSLSGDNLVANSDVNVRDNTIEDADAAAIDLGIVNDGTLDVTVSGNQILNQSGDTTALQIQVDDGDDTAIIQNNEITGDGDAVGIALSGADVSGVSIQANDISGLDDGTGADAIAIDLNDADDGNAATVENNQLESNEVHLQEAGTGDDYDEQALINNNVVTRSVRILDQEGGTLQNDEVYGTVTAGVADATSGQFVDVGAGTYEEDSITVGTDVTIDGADGATLTTENTNAFFDISTPGGAVTITGFAFSAANDNAAADVTVSDTSNDVTVTNSVFDGPGTSNREAVSVDDISADSTITVADNEFSNYARAVQLDQADTGDDAEVTLDVVRNEFSNHSVAVDLNQIDSDTTTHVIRVNFNNIVGNTDGVVADNTVTAGNTDTLAALANFFGAESGPSGNFNGDGDTVTGDNAGDVTIDPFLEGPVTNLPTDQYVVVPDPQPPIADGGTNANVLVATLNDTLATGEDETTTTLIANNSGPLTISEGSGAATAADPIDYDVTSDTAGAYQLTARNNDGNIPRGSVVQTFTGTPTDVEVTAENDTLVADDSSTVNATLTLVDSNGNAVDPGANFGVTFLIDGAGDAGVTRITDEDLDTSTPNSEARLEISADTSDVELEITGVYDQDGFSDSVNVTTVQNQMNVTVTPSTVTAGNDTDIQVEAVDAASGSGIDSANVELSGAGVSQTLLTNSSGVATTSVNASEAGTIEVNVSADGFDNATESITVEQPEQPVATVTFDDQTVQNGTEEVTVESANFTRADGSAGDYVVVVHVVNATEFDGGVDNSISAPVGASSDLTGAEENITVDLNSSANFEDGDELDRLTENVTLRAMLHTTDNDSAFGTRLGVAIDGLERGDETDDANITVQDESAVESPGDLTGNGEAATDPDGDGAFEDINGDGTVTAADVTALFNELDGEFSSDARLDINGEGDGLTAADVTALFNEV